MESKKRTVGAVFAALGKAVCYLFLFLLSQVIVTLGYTLTATIYAFVNPELNIDPAELALACTDQISLISGLLTLLILVVFFLLRRKNPLKEVDFRRTPARCVCAALSVTPFLYAAVIFILSLLPEAWMESYAEASSMLTQTGPIMAIATVVVAPIVEETIFRGLILSRLRKVMPGWLSVIISALLFGVCHGQIVWICYAFVLGLIFGVMAQRSGSVLPSLLAHVLFNAIGQFSSYIPDTNTAYWIFLGSLALISFIAMPIFHRGMTTLFFSKPQKGDLV